MFERLLSFLKELPGAPPDRATLSVDDPRVAAAALMFHVMDADGERGADERALLEKILAESHDLDDAELARIITAAEEADREAVDLYVFTSVLKRHLDAKGRADLIGIMWEIVYADGELHEVEDNVVWRVAELIGVESRDRVEMRRRARESAGLSDAEA